METKKGTVIDIFFLSVFVILAAAAILIMFSIFSDIRTAMNTAGLLTPAGVNITSDSLASMTHFNTLLFIMYSGVSMGAVISAFAVRTHPLYFVAFFLILIIMLTILPNITPIYSAVAATPDFNASAGTYFPNFTTFMNYLPTFALIVSIMVALAMFALPYVV